MATAEKIRSAEDFLTIAIASQGEILDTSAISATVEQFSSVLSSPLYGFQESDFEVLIKSLETRFVTTMDKGVVLTDDTYHDEDWYKTRDVTWSYWDDYSKYLTQERWAPRVVQSLDTVTSTILGLLQDPLQEGEWERRGLVIGHVQSGKTANYVGLISKAADAGYKFIIVIAGIHNELRRQTQERIDRGFIGRDSTTKQPVGVGLINRGRAVPVTVTTADSDFNRSASRNFGVGLNALSNTFILVIKKNASTLSYLYTWLKELNTRKGFEQIADIPMLLIDDEADNASINTSRPDLDPTRINREIRRILNLFRKKCFVGYTATPFANIFIDPDAYDDRLGADLFPKHFIYSLDAPSNYFGYERIFLDDKGKDDFIQIIEDADNWLPADHKKDTPVYELPASLKSAINLFVLARAVRNLRGQAEQHSSMLINISRFVGVQQEVRTLVDYYLGNLRKAVRYNYALPWEKASKDSIISELYRDFQVDYGIAVADWQDVLGELNTAADAVKVAVVNSRSQEKLLYTDYNRDHVPLTVIAIGGLSLSRGLTLEGLTISYIHRSTKMYDTLLQMGRWFGYRPGYEDLCRVFMSELSYEWYAYIADATEELRLQVKRMRREGKNPIDFGLYVKAHPDALTVTALNKMYHTESRSFSISYDGKLVETYILPENAEKTENNRQLLRQAFGMLIPQHKYMQDTDGTRSYAAFNVQWSTIQDFIINFQFHDDLSEVKGAVARYVKAIADLYPLWDVGFISIRDGQPEDGFMIASQTRTIGYNDKSPRIPVSEFGWYTGNKNRFSGNTMFKIGLNETQLSRAQVEAQDAKRKEPIYRDYTNGRQKPILLFHLLSLREDEQPPFETNIPAISISFPNSAIVRTVDYIVNPVWLKQLTDGQPENQEEDDFDPEPLG